MNLNKLYLEREAARQDKAELFDFYNDNWDDLIAEIEYLREKNQSRDNEIERLNYILINIDEGDGHA